MEERKLRANFLGATTLEIEKPKKKKLVYQWCYEQINGKMDITGAQFGIHDIDEVRGYVRNMRSKEGGKLFPLMESEKEIDT